ncbi:hypothetical protein BH09PSE4_BH09PSE4_12080 [soil metagenome]
MPAMLPILLLVCAALAYLAFLRANLPRHRLFGRLGPRGSRLHRYRVAMAKSALFFAIPTLLALALLGRLEAVASFPSEFAAAAAWIGPLDTGLVLAASVCGLMGGTLLAGIVGLRRRRTGKRAFTFGDVDAILPRNRVELAHTALLSLTAGVTEELFFRLLLPLLIALVTGSALLGFAVATAMFGIAHLYQKWIGVIAAGVVGLVLAALYLATGTLWLAILVHALLDIVALVIRPAFTGAWRKREANEPTVLQR